MATIDEFALKNIGLWWRYGHCDEWKYIIIGRIFESEIILIPPSLKISESSSNGSYRNTHFVERPRSGRPGKTSLRDDRALSWLTRSSSSIFYSSLLTWQLGNTWPCVCKHTNPINLIDFVGKTFNQSFKFIHISFFWILISELHFFVSFIVTSSKYVDFC
jgi:hypothetical protein